MTVAGRVHCRRRSRTVTATLIEREGKHTDGWRQTREGSSGGIAGKVSMIDDTIRCASLVSRPASHLIHTTKEGFGATGTRRISQTLSQHAEST